MFKCVNDFDDFIDFYSPNIKFSFQYTNAHRHSYFEAIEEGGLIYLRVFTIITKKRMLILRSISIKNKQISKKRFKNDVNHFDFSN